MPAKAIAVLLTNAVASGVADGTVTVAFRRWAAPRVAVGRRFRTVAGVVEVTAVEEIDPGAITDADATAAGAPSAAALRRELAARQGRTFRIGLAWAGADPRDALAELPVVSAAERAELDATLDRWDVGRASGPWTRELLSVIGERSGERAAELAPLFGRDVPAFKRDVRRLKGLGLTRSLARGYELSPRGRAYLDGSRRSPPAEA